MTTTPANGVLSLVVVVLKLAVKWQQQWCSNQEVPNFAAVWFTDTW
ncbi:hypothetical protein AVDCRST_MAG94-5734 [uncultured Leptolyngbya sp.]|uniref:Uncharacterized protein n=1 Tax=uncultured Leptolyngbya sp. TaxID=332963 RepID=A0A6J4P0F6_9CYAN|nr:hypothetical protein AVDCRST_MAG94-5734 [uncultured Leptolyngbya sp.]